MRDFGDDIHNVRRVVILALGLGIGVNWIYPVLRIRTGGVRPLNRLTLGRQ